MQMFCIQCRKIDVTCIFLHCIQADDWKIWYPIWFRWISRTTSAFTNVMLTLLGFSVLPRMPVHGKELPTQRERVILLYNTPNHIARTMATIILDPTLNRRVPFRVDSDLKVRDLVLVYYDRKNRWMSPRQVIDLGHEPVHIDFGGLIVEMSLGRRKTCRTADEVHKLIFDELFQADTAICKDSRANHAKNRFDGGSLEAKNISPD